MQPLWLCWALWALPLAGPGVALMEEWILDSLLQQLHLSKVPIVDKATVEGLVIPAHVRTSTWPCCSVAMGRAPGGRGSARTSEVRPALLLQPGPCGGEDWGAVWGAGSTGW